MFILETDFAIVDVDYAIVFFVIAISDSSDIDLSM